MNDLPATPVPSGRPPGAPKGATLPPGFPLLQKSPRGLNWQEQPAVWIVLAGLGALVLAGGGTPVWARALVLLGAGIWLVRNPPAVTLSRLFDWALLALFGAALLSFVPAAWLGRPDWRLDAQAFGVLLPSTNAPSPWLAAEALAQLLAGVAWLYAWWNLRLDHNARKYSLWGLSSLTTLLAAGEIVGRLLGKKYPLATEAAIFSYFPNRNQTGLWFCIGAVVTFGLMLEGMRRRRRWRGTAAGAMLLPCLLALVLTRSRMALALCALGCVLVVVVRFGRDAGNYLVRVLVPLGIIVLALLVFFERDTLQRMQAFGGSSGPESDFRLELWGDTLDMARAQPAGVGLDQFEDVYPQYRQRAQTFQSVRHPDSDWFWLLGETGWLGVAAAAVAVAALLKVFLGPAGRASGHFRQLAAVCAGLFLLHSLVDVPAHRFGTWLLAAWLLAIGAPDVVPPIPSLFPRAAFRAAGVLLAVLGVCWLGAAAGLPLNTTAMDERGLAGIDDAVTRGDDNQAMALANSVIETRPLRWWPYYQRARTELTLRDDRMDAQDDFRRARFLEPTWARLPFAEGMLWMPYEPALAFAAWREAVQRNDAVADGIWRDICVQLRTLPEGPAYISNLSKTRPLYRYEYLLGVDAALFPAEWADDLGRDPALKSYTPAQRQDLLERWATLDGDAALAYLQAHPTAAARGWMVQMRALAQLGKFSEALAVARNHLAPEPVPKFPGYDDTDTAELLTSFKTNPSDLAVGSTLFKLQLDDGKIEDGLATLDQMAAQKKKAPFVWWWRSQLLSQLGRPADAWDALQPYLAYKRQLETPRANASIKLVPAPQVMILRH